MDQNEIKSKAFLTGCSIDRLGFLKLVAASGITGIAASLLPSFQKASAAAPKAAKTRQWMLLFDLRKCEGCVTQGTAPQCMEGCIKEHFVPTGQTWIKVFEMEGAAGHPFFMPRPCMQCENAPCLNVCPVGATYRNAEGIILVNHETCIGCRMCMAACPYSARYFNWEEPENPAGATLHL